MAKPDACECTASDHATNGVKARGIDARVCGAEIEPKYVRCRPCTLGNHARLVCPEYVAIPVAAHLDRRCARCGFDSAKHALIPELGGRPAIAAYGRLPEALGPNVARFGRWLGRMRPARPRAIATVMPDSERVPAESSEPEPLDVLEIESLSGRQVVAAEPDVMPDRELKAGPRRPCKRCGRPTDDLPVIASRAPEWAFTRCPRCHRSTLHRAKAAA